MANTYSSFIHLAAAWKKKSPKREVAKSLREVGLYMRAWIREHHGSFRLQKESEFTIAKKGSSSPLRDTGQLAKAVSFSVDKQRETVILYSKKGWLQRIHEYGAKWRMTDKQRRFLMAQMTELGIKPKSSSGQKGWIVIPPRPIWRMALIQNEGMIKHMVRKNLLRMTN